MSTWKIFLHMVIIYSVLFTLAYFTSEIISVGLPFTDVFTLLTASFLISLVTYLFFIRGFRKNEKNSAVLTLAAIGVKFGLYLILILVFYILSKIKGIEFIITFFIIYLSFTIYLLRSLIYHLKHNISDR